MSCGSSTRPTAEVVAAAHRRAVAHQQPDRRPVRRRLGARHDRQSRCRPVGPAPEPADVGVRHRRAELLGRPRRAAVALASCAAVASPGSWRWTSTPARARRRATTCSAARSPTCCCRRTAARWSSSAGRRASSPGGGSTGSARSPASLPSDETPIGFNSDGTLLLTRSPEQDNVNEYVVADTTVISATTGDVVWRGARSRRRGVGRHAAPRRGLEQRRDRPGPGRPHRAAGAAARRRLQRVRRRTGRQSRPGAAACSAGWRTPAAARPTGRCGTWRPAQLVSTAGPGLRPAARRFARTAGCSWPSRRVASRRTTWSRTTAAPRRRWPPAAASTWRRSPATAWWRRPTADGRIGFYRARTLDPAGAPLREAPGETEQLSFSEDGRLLLVRGATGSIRLVDTASRTQLGEPIEQGLDRHRRRGAAPRRRRAGGADRRRGPGVGPATAALGSRRLLDGRPQPHEGGVDDLPRRGRPLRPELPLGDAASASCR